MYHSFLIHSSADGHLGCFHVLMFIAALFIIARSYNILKFYYFDYIKVIIHSVQFSCSVMSNSLWPYELQHTRPPCPSPTPRVHPNPCTLSQWYHSTISSSVILFSSCPQYFPVSGSFQMSQLFTLGGQSIGVSASTSVLPMNTQDWSPLGWTGWQVTMKEMNNILRGERIIREHNFGLYLFNQIGSWM